MYYYKIKVYLDTVTTLPDDFGGENMTDIPVEEEFLKKWVAENTDYSSLKEFRDDYTCDTTANLYDIAKAAGAIKPDYKAPVITDSLEGVNIEDAFLIYPNNDGRTITVAYQ